MALSFAHGAVQWLAADAAATNYVVTGLGFQPKALRFYWVGIGSATDAATLTSHIRAGVGFATSPSDRRCVGMQDQDAATTSVCTTGVRADAVAATFTSTPAADGLLDLTAVGSDGFTLTVDDQAPVNVTVGWEAWGGDITVAATGEISEPAATGDVDYTVTGFVAGATDQVVLFAGVQATGATPSAARTDSGLCVGFATAVGNVVVATNADDASADMDTDAYIQGGECLAMMAVGGGNPSARATLTQFGTNNFRLNWIARATTGRKSIFLAIKGGAWAVGETTIDLTATGTTATVSSLGFTPIGLSVLWTLDSESSVGVSTTIALLSHGSGSSPSSRRSMTYFSADAQAAANCALVVEYDQIATYATADFATLDLDDMGADSFRLIHDVGITTPATSWVGYLTFGTASTVKQGSGTAALTLGLTGVGASLRSGTGTSALTLGTTGAGVSVYWGTGTAALILGATGVGETPAIAVPDGSGIAVLTLSTAGAGVSARRGTGTAQLGLSVTGVGESPAIPVAQGDGVVAMTLAATGTGDRVSWGSGEALLALVASGVGSGEFVSMVNVRMSLTKPGLTGTVAHVGQIGAVTRVGGLRVTVDPVMEVTEEDEP